VDAPTGVEHALCATAAARGQLATTLDRQDVAALRASVEEISSRFYADAEWSG
jgi:hypothetical protein